MDKQRINAILDVFYNAPVVQTFGMKLEFNEEGQATVSMPYNPDYDNAGDSTHGGILTALLDNAGILTCACGRKEMMMTTSELSIHMIRPAIRTGLVAHGRIIKRGKLQDVAEMHCYDDKDNLVAHGIGTFTVIEKP